MQCVQISDPWLMHEVLAIANEHPEVIDKPRGFPLPIYDCFDRVRASNASGGGRPLSPWSRGTMSLRTLNAGLLEVVHAASVSVLHTTILLICNQGCLPAM